MVPESVIEQLRESGKSKIVILAAPSIAKVLKNEYPARLKDIEVEVAQSVMPRTFPERLFYFFYSYLIFTETTKMLATYGVRVDAPPAGGNRYLFFIKSLVANTLGRFNWIKIKLVPVLYHRVFRRRLYKEVFDKYHPDLVFISSIANFPDIDILAEAKRRDIETVAMASNWDHLNKYFVPLQSDWLLSQNEPMVQEAVELQGYRKERVVVIGFPQFDLYDNIKKYTDPRGIFLKKFGAPQNSRIILFIAGAAHYRGEIDVVNAILSWIKEGKFGRDVYLFIRTYPGQQEKYKKFESDPYVLFDTPPQLVTIEAMTHFFNQMHHANAVISIYSTTAIEAGILDKPLVAIGFDGSQKLPYHQSIVRAEKMSHIRHILDTGSVQVVRSFDDLFENVSEYLKNPQKDAEKRKILIKKMCYKIDGLASKRISDFILNHLNLSQ